MMVYTSGVERLGVIVVLDETLTFVPLRLLSVTATNWSIIV